MKIRFTLWNMECQAVGTYEDGQFEGEHVMVSGLLEPSELAGTVCALDELQEAMDKAAKEQVSVQYEDNTMYFGEGC